MAGLLSGCAGDKPTVDPKTTNAPKTPNELVIGKWTSAGDSVEFNQKGEVTAIENGEQKHFTYKLAAIDGSKDSITIILSDGSGKNSSETAVFKNEDTMVIGDTTFKRANAANSGPAVQETKTFSDPAYLISFKYPASMRVDLMDNNNIKLTNGKYGTYFIRCEKKFVQDSLKLGYNYEGTAKSYIKITVDNLKKVDAISNYSDSSLSNSDGSAAAVAIFNAEDSKGYAKVRLQAVVMNDYILATTVWSDEKGYDNAVKELTSILDTMAIK